MIINYGGIVFSVVALDLDHWMWCILFGFGSLLWGQVNNNFCNFLIQIKVNLIFYLNYFQLVISFPTKLFKKIVNAFVCLPRRKKNYTDSKLVYAVNDPQLDNSIDFLKVNNAKTPQPFCWWQKQSWLQVNLKYFIKLVSKRQNPRFVWFWSLQKQQPMVRTLS